MADETVLPPQGEHDTFAAAADTARTTRRTVTLGGRVASKVAAQSAARAAAQGAAQTAAGSAVSSAAGGVAGGVAGAASAAALPATIGLAGGKLTSTASLNSLEGHIPTAEEMYSAMLSGRPLATLAVDASQWGLWTPLVEGRIDGADALHHLYDQTGGEKVKNVFGKVLAIGTGSGTVERSIATRWQANAAEALRRLPPDQRQAQWAGLIAAWRTSDSAPPPKAIAEAAGAFGMPVPPPTAAQPHPGRTLAGPTPPGGPPTWAAQMRTQLGADPNAATTWGNHMYTALLAGWTPSQLAAASAWVGQRPPDAHLWQQWVAGEIAADPGRRWQALATALHTGGVPNGDLAAAAAELGVAAGTDMRRPIYLAGSRTGHSRAANRDRAAGMAA